MLCNSYLTFNTVDGSFTFLGTTCVKECPFSLFTSPSFLEELGTISEGAGAGRDIGSNCQVPVFPLP